MSTETKLTLVFKSHFQLNDSLSSKHLKPSSRMAISILLALLSCVLTAEASIASRHAAKQKRDTNTEPAQQQPSRDNPNAYLNDKTKPYWVNGSALPEIDFNIGESYSGLLPVDESKELFFWFVPSVNPAASNEVTLWLNGGPGCSSLDGFLHEVNTCTRIQRPIANSM